MIRFKIAILFSFLTGLALLFFIALVAYQMKRNTDRDFFRALLAKARLEAQVVLEKDELTAEIYQEVIDKHLDKLPKEKGQVISLLDSSALLNNNILTAEIVAKTIKNGEYQIKSDTSHLVYLFYQDNQGDFIIAMSAENTEGEKRFSVLINNMFLGLVITMVIQFIVGLAFARGITFPIYQIIEQLDKVKTSDLSNRLNTKRNKDEVNQLITTINNLLDRLESGFNAQKQFISNASHELKTPLTVIRGESETVLRKQRKTDDYENSLRKINSESERLTAVLESLLQLTEITSTDMDFQKEVFNIEELLLEAQTEMFQFSGGKNLIKVSYDHDAIRYQVFVKGKRNWVFLALINVFKNALKYSGFQKDVLVKLESSNLLNKSGVCIMIIDQGIGIHPDDISSITAPFKRGKNTHNYEGQGVGLSVVDHVIKLHGGILDINSMIDEGTVIQIHLPTQASM